MANTEAVEVAPSHFRYIVGYGLTSVWATMLLFSSQFSLGDLTSVVTVSMLFGVAACVVVLVARNSFSRHCGRSPLIALCAVGMAAGTFLCTFPAFSTIYPASMSGVALSGFCAMPLLLSWFTEYAALPSRTIVFLAGCALMFAAVSCFALAMCPQQVAAAVLGLSPLVSFAMLPRRSEKGVVAPEAAGSPDGTDSTVQGAVTIPDGESLSQTGQQRQLPSLAKVVTQAVSWRTLLGIVIVFFVMGSLGALSPHVDLYQAELSPLLLLYPAAVSCFFAGSAFLVRKRIDASIVYKVLLVALSGLLFAMVFLGRASLSYIFYTYITCDVLLWTVLALASKSTPVHPSAVFIVGWLAECLGNVVGHNAASLMVDTTVFAAVEGLLVIVAIGFAFSEGRFMLDLEEEDQPIQAGEPEPLQASTGEAGSQAGHMVRLDGGNQAAGGGPSASGQPMHQPQGVLDASHVAGEGIAQQASLAHSAENAMATRNGEDEVDNVARFVEAHGLSRREAEVFALWVTGHGLKYIQETLFISESTVKTHMRSIYRKCDVHNRAEIIDLFESECPREG